MKRHPSKRPQSDFTDELSRKMVEGEELTPSEASRFSMLTAIFTMLIENPRSVVVKMVMEEYEISQSQAYRNINIAQELFGHIEKPNRLAEKVKQIARLEAIVTDPLVNVKSKIEAEKLLAKITGTTIHETEKDKHVLPIIITYTDNVEDISEIEDTEYEDLSDAS